MYLPLLPVLQEMEDGQHGVHALRYVMVEPRQEHVLIHLHHVEEQTVQVPHLRHVTPFHAVGSDAIGLPKPTSR